MVPGYKRLLPWTAALLLAAASVQAAPDYGKLAGIVVDPSGSPQLGATVWVTSEDASGSAGSPLLTNQGGQFLRERLRPGLYSVRVTLAGFLPSIERHVRISSNVTTLLKIEVETIFTSFDRLRRGPEKPKDADEWKWVLRTSAATRPVLQWLDGEATVGGEKTSTETTRRGSPRGRLELTSGANRPGAVSNLADSPATSFAYEQRIGHTSRLLFAGQMSYERSATAGIATMWLPSGELGRGPETTLVLRQAKLGPAGPTFRGLRLQHANHLVLGGRFTLRYGGEYVVAGFGPTTSALRPRGELEIHLSPNWRASMIAATLPGTGGEEHAGTLDAALAELNGLPALLLRDGRPVLEHNWHEEVAFDRRLGARSSLQVAAFRDRARHRVVSGRGVTSDPELFRDSFSDAFLFDGGASSSWGARVGYRQKFSDGLELAAVYAWAGAFVLEDAASGVDLRVALHTRNRHSLATRVSGRLPRAGTRLAASYKWIDGPVVSRHDVFGEKYYQLHPFFNLSVRQPLPSFLMNGRWEALADFRNLLAQGYVPVKRQDGQLWLVPAFRSFRGGVSFQF